MLGRRFDVRNELGVIQRRAGTHNKNKPHNPIPTRACFISGLRRFRKTISFPTICLCSRLPDVPNYSFQRLQGERLQGGSQKTI